MGGCLSRAKSVCTAAIMALSCGIVGLCAYLVAHCAPVREALDNTYVKRSIAVACGWWSCFRDCATSLYTKGKEFVTELAQKHREVNPKPASPRTKTAAEEELARVVASLYPDMSPRDEQPESPTPEVEGLRQRNVTSKQEDTEKLLKPETPVDDDDSQASKSKSRFFGSPLCSPDPKSSQPEKKDL